MISQKCPKCNSKRTRRGYRPTSIFSKLLFRYHLLCDNCNWEFKGFAIPGIKASKQTRSSREKRDLKNNSEPKVDSAPLIETPETPTSVSAPRVKKKVKIRI